jgi:GNAT superfamily N-acetyltransferase
MIRKAENKDVSGIIGLVKEAHRRSISQCVKLDSKIIRTNVQVCVLSAEHFVVVVELDGKIEGVLIGVTHQLWYSRKKQATDLFFYVTENGTGWGAKLMRRFISWAKENRGVKEIMLGITSGIGDAERTKQLYERMGAVRIGDTFVLPQE